MSFPSEAQQESSGVAKVEKERGKLSQTHGVLVQSYEG